MFYQLSNFERYFIHNLKQVMAHKQIWSIDTDDLTFEPFDRC